MYKLLILGATYNEIAIIERARFKGIYTIVTDYNQDYSKSPAKNVADEVWDISWSDIDTLYKKCCEANVNGVIAGFSEFRVENMIRLCEKLNLPCPLTMEQLDVTRDKIKFKKLCLQYGIGVVPEYQYGDDLNYPVIIKPVDRAGSIGINVAHNYEEFESFYKIAYDLSPTKNVIIEDYIDDGIKVDFYYYIKEGKTTLLGTSDTIMCEGELGAPILQKAWIFPSQFAPQYISDEDAKIKTMIQGIGLKNGYATMSAFYRNGSFYFFEAGFRLSGELSYNYYENISGINYIDTLIDYALKITNTDQYTDCFRLNERKSVILNFFGLDGCVKNIQLPIFENDSEVNVIADFFVKEEDIIKNDTGVFKKIAMYTMISSNEKKLKCLIKHINSNLHITDKEGRSLIYERVDENVLGFTPEIFNIANHTIKLLQKPYWISLKELQNLLNKSHETNNLIGLIYATQNQSISKLKEKLKDSICLILLVNNNLVATGSIQFRSINHWYHSGEIGLLKLLAVLPEYRGIKLASLLVKARLQLAKIKPVNIVVSDSAENNYAIKHLYLSEGFKIVDCCKYSTNNFVSSVYAKWLIQTPYTDSYISERYEEKRKQFAN